MNKDAELENAVKILQEKEIISNPNVWVDEDYSKNNVRSLIIKISNQIK